MKAKPSLMRVAVIAGVLFFLAATIGHYASHTVPQAVLVPLLKYSIGLIAIVWLFSISVYNKLSDVTDAPGLDYRQHRNIEVEIRARLQWFWLRAVFLGLLATCLYVPTILSDANIPIPDWVFALCFGSLAISLFALRRLLAELEEIRELRSHVKELERLDIERATLVKLLKDESKDEWEPDEKLAGFRNEAKSK